MFIFENNKWCNLTLKVILVQKKTPYCLHKNECVVNFFRLFLSYQQLRLVSRVVVFLRKQLVRNNRVIQLNYILRSFCLKLFRQKPSYDKNVWFLDDKCSNASNAWIINMHVNKAFYHIKLEYVGILSDILLRIIITFYLLQYQ